MHLLNYLQPSRETIPRGFLLLHLMLHEWEKKGDGSLFILAILGQSVNFVSKYNLDIHIQNARDLTSFSYKTCLYFSPKIYADDSHWNSDVKLTTPLPFTHPLTVWGQVGRHRQRHCLTLGNRCECYMPSEMTIINDVPCHSRCGTLKNPHCSMGMSAEYRLSSAMIMSAYQ